MYAKVFAQMYDGSLCTHGPWEALVTFQQMLVLSDLEGTVDMTAEAISRRTTIPLKIIEKGIAELLKPDSKSRTPAEEGRRIIPLTEGRDWGWQVVNYKHYRQLQREADRREYHRDYWHKRKATQQTQQTQPNQPIAYAEAEADTEKKTNTVSGLPQAASPPPAYDGENESQIATRAIVKLAANWGLPQAWGDSAEALGWPNAKILKEAERFRQYWTEGKGAGTRKSLRGWRQAWSNWLAKADRMGSV